MTWLALVLILLPTGEPAVLTITRTYDATTCEQVLTQWLDATAGDFTLLDVTGCVMLPTD